MIRPALIATLAALLSACSPANALWDDDSPPWAADRDDSVEPPARLATQSAANRREGEDCGFPSPPEGAEVVALGLYEGAALSSASIGGQDMETNFVTVTIEAGTAPVYLILTSYESMVWNVTGATDRIARVVIGGYSRDTKGRLASGVIGVPEAALFFTPRGCLDYFYEVDRSVYALRPLIAQGIAPQIRGAYSAEQVWLPSGKLSGKPMLAPAAPKGFDEPAWREALRYWPGGVTMVDPRHVLSPAVVRSYQVLPSQAGLAQLIGSGAIVRPGSRYYIVREIPRLPARMNGGHSVQMTLAPGLPIPAGEIGHSCLLIEETGEQRGACRRR